MFYCCHAGIVKAIEVTAASFFFTGIKGWRFLPLHLYIHFLPCIFQFYFFYFFEKIGYFKDNQDFTSDLKKSFEKSMAPLSVRGNNRRDFR